MGLFSVLSRRSASPTNPVHLASPEFKANPYPYYAKLRAEAPAHRVTLPIGMNAWLITQYDDVAYVLKDERFIKDKSIAMTPEQIARQPLFRKLLNSNAFTSLTRSMINQDPPDHTRLRSLVNKAFTPRLVEQMRERIQTLADELLDAVQHRGRMDLVRDYALPIPTTVIAEMLGVQVADRHRFQRWSNAISSMLSSKWNLVRAIPNLWALKRYIRKFIRQRRADPRDDLMTALVRAEESGDRLSEGEMLGMIILLLLAGYETTANLIGNSTLALLEHPDQLEKLRNEPALIKPAIEELLRYTSPVELASARYTRESVSLAGVTIPRGEAIFPVIASANRDERQFINSDSLDITREPNKHLSFGFGNHFCLGAALARLEGQIAMNTLLRRLPDLRLEVSPEALLWRRSLMLRGLRALPVAFGTPSPRKPIKM